MLIRRPTGIPESEITPEPVYRQRRRLLAGVVALPLAGLAGCGDAREHEAPPASGAGDAVEELTSYRDASTYNNFYEFGTGKADPARNAHSLVTSPWVVVGGGLCERTGPMALEDLLAGIAVEERVYRLRCVEGWSMVIPWLGVPLASVLEKFRPLPSARYVALRTLADREQMPGIRVPVLDWPYREGLRMDEAMHPLTILATGMYGRELPNQNGAPLRLVVPWKYGFKSIKSIVAIEFTQQQPPTSWNQSQPSEYGFYSNVNPEVDHPRWSQASERRLAGEGSRLFANRIPTRMFNGYADQVAGLYAGMDLTRQF